MPDAAGFDECEYCECGRMNCDGSCYEEECLRCGSDRCDGHCDDKDTQANQNAPKASSN